MSVTHATAVRTAIADTVVDGADAGSSFGKLKIRAGATVLAIIILQDPAFGPASAGAASLLGVPLSVAAIAGAPSNADNFQVTDSDDNVKFSGSVTATGGGGDLTLDNVSITAGQTVTVSSGTYTAPA